MNSKLNQLKDLLLDLQTISIKELEHIHTKMKDVIESRGGKICDIFICPHCKALYCEKCANALSMLENECWSCDNRIDESRPIKQKEVEKDSEPEIKEIHKVIK